MSEHLERALALLDEAQALVRHAMAQPAPESDLEARLVAVERELGIGRLRAIDPRQYIRQPLGGAVKGY